MPPKLSRKPDGHAGAVPRVRRPLHRPPPASGGRGTRGIARPTAGAAPPLAERERREERPPAGPVFGGADDFSPPKRDEEGALGPLTTICGVGLLGVSFLGLVASGFRLFISFSPEHMQKLQQVQRNFGGGMGADPETMKMINVIFSLLFGIVSVTGLAGGIAIIRRNSFALAFLGSMAAMVNLNDCCCVLGARSASPASSSSFSPRFGPAEVDATPCTAISCPACKPC